MYYQWVLFFIFYHDEFVLMEKWQTCVVKKVIGELNPYQVTLFSREENLNIISDCNSLLYEIISNVPTIFINSTHIQTDDNIFSDIKVHENPRAARVLYVILLNQEINDAVMQYLKNTFEEFKRLAPLHTRPKCLLIDFNMNALPDVVLRDLFEYVWFNQFLDFTILKIINKEYPLVFYHNPFLNTIKKEYLDSETNIFPDKLQNIYKYPIKVAAFVFPAFLEVIKNPNNESKLIYLKWNFGEKVADCINAELQHVFIEGTDLPLIYWQVVMKLMYSEVNVANVALMVSPVYGKTTMGKNYNYIKLVMVVPIIKYSTFDVSSTVSIFILISPILMICLFIIIRFLCFSRKICSIFNLFKILVGISIKNESYQWKELFVILGIIIFSVQYSAYLMVVLINENIIFIEEKAFDTLEEIYESNIPLYVGIRFIYDTIFYKSDKIVRKLKTRTNVINNLDDCYRDIAKNILSICIDIEGAAIDNMNKFNIANGNRIMKIAKPYLFIDNMAFMYEQASPFVEKFDSILQRFIDYGMADIPTYKNERKMQFDVSFKKDNYSMGYIWFLVIDYAICLVVFSIELLINKYDVLRVLKIKLKKNNKKSNENQGFFK